MKILIRTAAREVIPCFSGRWKNSSCWLKTVILKPFLNTVEIELSKEKRYLAFFFCDLLFNTTTSIELLKINSYLSIIETLCHHTDYSKNIHSS